MKWNFPNDVYEYMDVDYPDSSIATNKVNKNQPEKLCIIDLNQVNKLMWTSSITQLAP